MKKLLLLALTLATFSINAQNDLVLNLVEKSNVSDKETTHFYKFSIKNNFKATKSIALLSEYIPCENIEEEKQSLLLQLFYDENKEEVIDDISLQAGETGYFYLKLKRPQATTLNTFNCTKVFAELEGVTYSNTISLKKYIPDPQTFN